MGVVNFVAKWAVYSLEKSLIVLVFKYVDFFGIFFVHYNIYLLNVAIYSQTEKYTHIQFFISYDQQFIEKKGTRIIVYRRNSFCGQFSTRHA